MSLFNDVSSRVDDPFFARALELAVSARGETAPNPLVGAVVVRDGSVVGEGHHLRAGEPHAEVIALADAGERARGADLYVTLEPCSHHGRTPPCTEAIIAAGIRRVFVGMRDPNPQAAGGIDHLAAAGIEVDLAGDERPFRVINRGWLKRLESGRPFVTVKVAASLDGRISLAQGLRSSITGESGARVTRTLRSHAQAVVVGASTAIIDDPALTVRDEQGPLADRQPLRVVLARRTPPPLTLRLFTTREAPTLLVAPHDVLAALRGVLPVWVETEANPRGEELTGALDILGTRGMNDVLVEAGPTLLRALADEGLIDHLVIVTAGGMVGLDAPSLWQGPPDREGSALVHRYHPVESGIVGDVIVNIWEPASGAPDEGKA